MPVIFMPTKISAFSSLFEGKLDCEKVTLQSQIFVLSKFLVQIIYFNFIARIS